MPEHLRRRSRRSIAALGAAAYVGLAGLTVAIWFAIDAVLSRFDESDPTEDSDIRIVAAWLILIPLTALLMHWAWTFAVAALVPRSVATRRLGALSAGLFALLVGVAALTSSLDLPLQIVTSAVIMAAAAGAATWSAITGPAAS